MIKKKRIVMLFFVIVSLCVVLSFSKTSTEAKTDDGTSSPIIIDEGTEDAYELPYDATKLVEEALKKDPKFEGYVQSEGIVPNIEIDPSNKTRLSAPTRALTVASTTKLADGYLHTLRVMHKGGTYTGGWAFVKVGFDGKVKNQWYVYFTQTSAGVGKPNWTTRLYLGALTGSDGYVYGMAGNQMAADGTDERYQLIGVDPTVEPSTTNLWPLSHGKRKSINVGNAVSTLSLPSLHEYSTMENIDDSQSLFVGTTLSTDSVALNNTINIGELRLDNNDSPNVTNKVSLRYKPFSDVKKLYPGLENRPGQSGSLDMVVPQHVKKLPNGDYIVGINYSGAWTDKHQIVETIQVFSSTGTLKHEYLPISTTLSNGTGYYENTRIDSSKSSDTSYFFLDDRIYSRIIKYDHNTETFANQKAFPSGTQLTFKEVNGQFYYFGSTPTLNSLGFNGFSAPIGVTYPYTVSGLLEDPSSSSPFKVLSLTAENNGKTTSNANAQTIFSYLDLLDDETLYVAGQTDSTSFGTLPNLGISTNGGAYPLSNSAYLMSFFGLSSFEEDYAPAVITDPKSINLDLDYLKKNSTEKDELLLRNENKDYNVKVFDSIDNKNITEANTWLENRINRNPYNTNLSIDWDALGFKDDDKYGPNNVTYFVTDSQMQTTSVSRIVNKVNKEVKYDQEKALGAENFDISISDVEGLTKDEVKKKANTMVWTLEDGKKLTDLSGITVDSSQLKDITAAKKEYDAKKAASEYPGFVDYSEIIKPYPLTLTYSYELNGASKTLSRELTVFITDETTFVNQEKNEVIYGSNFRYSLQEANKLTDKEIVELSHASAWSYDNVWGVGEKSIDLTTNRTAAFNSADEPKTGLNNAKSARDDYELTLSTNNATNNKVRVSLFNDISNIKILYQDENGKELHDPITFSETIGKTINLLDITDNTKAIASVLSKNYELEDSGRPTDEKSYVVKDSESANTLIYTFKGLLTPTFNVPENLNFGKHTVQNVTDETLVASSDGSQTDETKQTKGSILINDTRSIAKGWELKVRQEEAFSNDSEDILSDTSLNLTIGSINGFTDKDETISLGSDTGDTRIIQAEIGKGLGKTTIPLEKFELDVFRDSVKQVSTYQTTIVWTLSDTPS